jgi:hypothetical protein
VRVFDAAKHYLLVRLVIKVWDGSVNDFFDEIDLTLMMESTVLSFRVGVVVQNLVNRMSLASTTTFFHFHYQSFQLSSFSF